MKIPFGARNNNGLFREDHLLRKLPRKVVHSLRYLELIVIVWHTRIKNKQGAPTRAARLC